MTLECELLVISTLLVEAYDVMILIDFVLLPSKAALLKRVSPRLPQKEPEPPEASDASTEEASGQDRGKCHDQWRELYPGVAKKQAGFAMFCFMFK